MIPVYYVIVETKPILPMMMFNAYTILKVVECNFEDVQKLWEKEVAPLQYENSYISALIFYREPSNPFREWEHR